MNNLVTSCISHLKNINCWTVLSYVEICHCVKVSHLMGPQEIVTINSWVNEGRKSKYPINMIALYCPWKPLNKMTRNLRYLQTTFENTWFKGNKVKFCNWYENYISMFCHIFFLLELGYKIDSRLIAFQWDFKHIIYLFSKIIISWTKIGLVIVSKCFFPHLEQIWKACSYR